MTKTPQEKALAQQIYYKITDAAFAIADSHLEKNLRRSLTAQELSAAHIARALDVLYGEGYDLDKIKDCFEGLTRNISKARFKQFEAFMEMDKNPKH